MKVKFWGARGSMPTPMTEGELQDKIKAALLNAVGVDLTDRDAVDRYVERLPPTIASTAGGNTSCIEIRAGNELLILDCGSGMRMLGYELMKESFGKGQGMAHIFLTHTHWDHVQGLTMFNPMYAPGNVFHFHSPYPDLKMRFEDQQREIYFPVPLDYMRATRTWDLLDPDETVTIGGVEVRMTLLSHPGGAYAYRFSYNGKVLVYATDGEYHRMDQDSTSRYVEFFHDADMLIFDAQYSFQQAIDEKRDWGHSTPKMGAELAFRAGVKCLALYHHDPVSNDETLWEAVDEADHHLVFRGRATKQNNSKLTQVILAREGLSVDL
ncbi:MAG: MBL fold metallo-hydrolase [Chloroflexota bacterium]